MQTFIFLTCQLTDLCGAKVCLKVAVRRDVGEGTVSRCDGRESPGGFDATQRCWRAHFIKFSLVR